MAHDSPDRSSFRRKEPTGEAETLVGRVDAKKFGDRAERARPKTEQVDKAKKKYVSWGAWGESLAQMVRPTRQV